MTIRAITLLTLTALRVSAQNADSVHADWPFDTFTMYAGKSYHYDLSDWKPGNVFGVAMSKRLSTTLKGVIYVDYTHYPFDYSELNKEKAYADSSMINVKAASALSFHAELITGKNIHFLLGIGVLSARWPRRSFAFYGTNPQRPYYSNDLKPISFFTPFLTLGIGVDIPVSSHVEIPVMLKTKLAAHMFPYESLTHIVIGISLK